jgi:hypothetical protein
MWFLSENIPIHKPLSPDLAVQSESDSNLMSSFKSSLLVCTTIGLYNNERGVVTELELTIVLVSFCLQLVKIHNFLCGTFQILGKNVAFLSRYVLLNKCPGGISHALMVR